MKAGINLDIQDFPRQDWSRHLAGFADLNLMQCWEYAQAKERTGPWRAERGLFRRDGETVGAFQALLRPLPLGLPGGLAWINRGPLWRRRGEPDPAMVAAMLAELKTHYAEDRGMYLRLAPPLAAGALAGEAARAGGLAATPTPGWASAVLDLTAPLDELRKGLKGKWRGHLNQAERASLEVLSGHGGDLFRDFVESHRRLIADKGFATSLTAELLAALQEAFPEESKMEAFLAYHDGALVGSVLIARYGEACEYLAGNTSGEGRRLNAGQLVLWRAVEAMKERGCRRLDLGGMDPEATPRGIYQFKEGLGGTPYRLAGELEALGGGMLGRLVRWRVGRARLAA